MSSKRRKKGQFKVIPNEIIQAVVHELVIDTIVKDASLNFGAGFLSGIQWITSGKMGFNIYRENKTDTGRVGHVNLQWSGDSAEIAIAKALGFADALPATMAHMEFAQGFYHASSRAVDEISMALFKKIPVGN